MFRSKFNLSLRFLLFSMLAAWSCFGQSGSINQAAAQLKLNVPVEGSFASGETQTFALHLESNQFAALILNQKGVNLAITIDDAKNGTNLLKLDVNYADFGYERALIESGAEPRDLLIRVFPVLKDRAASAKFSLVLTELDPADARNKKRLASQTSILDGTQLLLEDKKESRLKGFLLLASALKSAREAHDPVLEATTLILLQRVYFLLGNLPKTIEYGEMVLPLLTSPENAYFQLIVKDTTGPALIAMKELKRGFEVESEVLVKAQEIGDKRLIMSSYINLGFANLRLDTLTNNIEYAEKAYQIAKDLDIKYSQVECIRIIGLTYFRLNDFNKAIETMNQALVLAKEANLVNFIFAIHQDLGRNFYALGQLQKAIDYYQLALDGNLRIGGSKDTAAQILFAIAGCYSNMGQTTRALEYQRQALQALNELGYKDAIAQGTVLQGKIFLNLRDFEKAKESFNQALELAKQGENLILVSQIYSYLALTERRLNHASAALEFNLQAEQIRIQAKTKIGEASSLNNIADSYILVGQPEKAADYAAQALEKSRIIGDRLLESSALYNLARVKRRQRDLVAALHLIEDSLNLVETVRAELINQESRTAYLSTIRDKYDFYISLLIELGNQQANKQFGAQAFAASEKARARGLLDLLAESRTDISAGINPELKMREQSIEAKLSSLQTQLLQLKLAEKSNEKRLGELQNNIQTADDEREQLESEIRRSNPRYAELKYPTTLNLVQTQSLLDEHTLLLEYQVGADASFLFAIGKSEFQIVRLPNEQALRKSVESLRSGLSVPTRTGLANYLVAGRELYQTLLAPIEKLLNTKTRIVVAADGALNYVPFEVLLQNNTTASLDKLPYLVRNFEISYTPSASVLANLNSQSTAPAAKPLKSFLAFAAPDYGTKPADQYQQVSQTRSVLGENRAWSLTALPYAKTEAEGIAKLFPAGQATVFTGAEATEERAKSGELLSQYRYLHFAVHGLIDEEQPQFSSLVLSLPKSSDRDSQFVIRDLSTVVANNSTAVTSSIDPAPLTPHSAPKEDGLLQTPEIFNLRLRADLVTLSACETGLGQEIRGEGIVGLTRAFFYAGTPSVLVSLWNVDDASTTELMNLFYEQLQKDDGHNKAAALRQAQLKLINENRYAHPYYWAPFVLQGKSGAAF